MTLLSPDQFGSVGSLVAGEARCKSHGDVKCSVGTIGSDVVITVYGARWY